MIVLKYLDVLGAGVLLVRWEIDKPILQKAERKLRLAPLFSGELALPTLRGPCACVANEHFHRGLGHVLTRGGALEQRHFEMILVLAESHGRLTQAQVSAAFDEIAACNFLS